MPEHKSPQQDPGDFQRLLLVFALTFIAIAASQFFLSKFGPRPTPKPEQTAAQQTGDTSPAPAATAPAAGTTQAPAATQQPAVSKATTASAKPTPPAPVTIKQAAAESTSVVENDLYKITFTNKGALVKSWVLKKHQDDAGHPLDLVNTRGSASTGYPLSLFTYDPALRTKVNSVLYVPSATGDIHAPSQVTFEYSDADVTVRKAFTFDQSYVIKIETSVQQHGSDVSAFPAWPSGFGDQTTVPAWASSNVDWYSGDKVERHPAIEGGFFSFLTGFFSGGGKKPMSNGATVNGPFLWAGVVDQYFGAVFLPDDPANATLVELHDVIPQNPNEKDPAKLKSEVFNVLGVAVGNMHGPTSTRLFVGPKALDTLRAIRSYGTGVTAATSMQPDGPGLDEIVDFGTFAIIAKPLFVWLNWTRDHWIQNWGWSIMVLTIIINLVLFPLRYPGMKSALLQQKIAPEMKAITRKYKDLKLTDPRQHDKQKEVNELMAREGINQFAGCVPTLIQFPFLLAFYAMLSTVNELRHAHWLWITDLSAPDPWRLLPILIVVTMFLMQRATPMGGVDEQQARMMQIMMPLMFGAFAWAMPAGLSVYMITGSLIGWGLQAIVNQTPMAREIRAHLAKRAEKKRK